LLVQLQRQLGAPKAHDREALRAVSPAACTSSRPAPCTPSCFALSSTRKAPSASVAPWASTRWASSRSVSEIPEAPISELARTKIKWLVSSRST
jgi:hypothetical protein